MKYMFDVEKAGSGSMRFINLAASCAFAGAFTGAVIALFGYAPSPELLLMAPAGLIVGGAVGGILGLLLSYVIFGQKLTNCIFNRVVTVASIAGAAGAVVFRILTKGQGGWLGAYPSILATVAAALWFRFCNPSIKAGQLSRK